MCIPGIILPGCFVENKLEQGGGFRDYCRNSGKQSHWLGIQGIGTREEQADVKIF